MKRIADSFFHVLHVDDSEGFRETFDLSYGAYFDLESRPSGAEALEILKEKS